MTFTLPYRLLSATVCCHACAESATLSPDHADQWATSHQQPHVHAITFTIGDSPTVHTRVNTSVYA